ncbi:MAG TPA: hypothetical protein VGI50_08220 [Solirubrobacteraceae bacterium]|jgi:hypothetical protein
MANSAYFVFSNPPAGVDELEYSAWYERHVEEILAGPGFTGARRYWLSRVTGGPPTNYRHLALYELEGEDSRSALTELSKRTAAGELTLRDWFEEIRFASFDAFALQADGVRLPDHAYLVFSNPPAQIGFETYNDWYSIHLRENLTADGFDAGWRFRVEADILDSSAPSAAAHAAIYDVSEEEPELRRALAESREDGRRVTYPDWFRQIEFASLDCHSIAPYVAAPA